MSTLTIFTPTYNRAYCLKKLYNSLKRQSNREFVWLVVDDGSTDDTKELIKEFQAEKMLELQYVYQENSGKHMAHNKAVELCKTELFVCVDSDDFLTDDAVERIHKRAGKLKDERVLGFFLRRISPKGENIATPYPNGIDRVGIMDLYRKYGFQGDTVIVFRTNMIKSHAFPVFKNEKFVNESVFYSMLNDVAPMALFEDGIYVCEYLPDGYTNNFERVLVNNPYGSAVFYLQEAIYGRGMLQRTKNFSQYKALIYLFRLDETMVGSVAKPSVIVRFGAILLLPHYLKLFKRLREKYEC